MPNTRQALPSLSQFERDLDAALNASGVDQLRECLASGAQSLRDCALEGDRPSLTFKALDAFFSRTQGDRRKRRMAELCSWPLFDKPLIPRKQGADSFLWLFTLPFMVTFSPKALARPLLVTGDCLDGEGLLDVLEESKALTPEARPRAFTTMLRRDDLHAFGPAGLARCFVQSEMGEFKAPGALPLHLDPEIDCHRSVLYFVPCAALLPVGTAELRGQGYATWDGTRAAALVKAGLQSEGMDVEEVRSFAPASMSQALLMCNAHGRAELTANIAEALRLYGKLGVKLRAPIRGIAELVAPTASGPLAQVMAPFSFLEPLSTLHETVEEVCASLNLPFMGTETLFSASHLHH